VQARDTSRRDLWQLWARRVPITKWSLMAELHPNSKVVPIVEVALDAVQPLGTIWLWAEAQEFAP